MLISVLAVSGCSNAKKTDAGSKGGTEGTSTASSSSSSTTDSKGWLAVTTVDGTQLFGHPNDTGDSSVLFLSDVYFVAQGSDAEATGSLRRFGTEIYKPLPVVEVPLTAILYAQALSAESPVVAAISEFEKTAPYAVQPVELVKPDQIYAVFLRNSQVYFGTLVYEPSGIVIKGAHFLSFKDQEVAALGTIKSLDDVTLVAQADTTVLPTGDITVPLDSVLYFQPLSDASPVVPLLKKP